MAKGEGFKGSNWQKGGRRKRRLAEFGGRGCFSRARRRTSQIVFGRRASSRLVCDCRVAISAARSISAGRRSAAFRLLHSSESKRHAVCRVIPLLNRQSYHGRGVLRPHRARPRRSIRHGHGEPLKWDVESGLVRHRRVPRCKTFSRRTLTTISRSHRYLATV